MEVGDRNAMWLFGRREIDLAQLSDCQSRLGKIPITMIIGVRQEI